MRFVLALIFVLASSLPATAQMRTDPALAPEARTATPRGNADIPVFSRIDNICVNAGDPLRIHGKNLHRLAGLPALINGTDKIILPPVHKSADTLLLRLPVSGLEKGAAYRLVIRNREDSTSFLDTQLTVRICPEEESLPPRQESTRELLVIVESRDKNAVLQALRQRNIRILRQHDLDALDGFLIVVTTGNFQEFSAELKAVFPEAEIDFNTEMSAAAPRLYAREAVKWTDRSQCLLHQELPPVGMIDGAIDKNHPALRHKTIHEKNFVEEGTADKSHATAVASILIGDAPAKGFQGLVPTAPLYNAAVLRITEDNRRTAKTETFLRGLDWLMTQKIRLINISLSGDENRVMSLAVKKSIAKGALLFAAAGNSGPQAPPSHPAAIEGVLAVTATDAGNRVYDKANHGDYIDFSAPGVDIWVADTQNSGQYMSGTSFASPYALATAMVYLARNPSISGSLLKKALGAQAVDLGPAGPDAIYGAGLVQAFCPDF